MVWYLISDIEGEFKKQLAILVPIILAPKNLVVKEISGQKVKAKELVQYFKSYIQIYKGSELPEPKSMLEVGYILFHLRTKRDRKVINKKAWFDCVQSTKTFCHDIEYLHMKIFRSRKVPQINFLHFPISNLKL